MVKRRVWILAMLALAVFAAYLLATTTDWTEQFASGHGWAYTEISCAGTCESGDVSSDGNPQPSIYDKVTGRNKSLAAYFSKSDTWENLGVPSGDTVDTVDGQWDSKAISTAVACRVETQAGMQIFDSANTTEITASVVEPLLSVDGDSTWTNHNPTGAVGVNDGYKASSTTITLRFNMNPYAGNNANAACELRGDNYKLTISSTAPSGRSRVVMISRRF